MKKWNNVSKYDRHIMILKTNIDWIEDSQFLKCILSNNTDWAGPKQSVDGHSIS